MDQKKRSPKGDFSRSEDFDLMDVLAQLVGLRWWILGGVLSFATGVALTGYLRGHSYATTLSLQMAPLGVGNFEDRFRIVDRMNDVLLSPEGAASAFESMSRALEDEGSGFLKQLRESGKTPEEIVMVQSKPVLGPFDVRPFRIAAGAIPTDVVLEIRLPGPWLGSSGDYAGKAAVALLNGVTAIHNQRIVESVSIPSGQVEGGDAGIWRLRDLTQETATIESRIAKKLMVLERRIRAAMGPSPKSESDTFAPVAIDPKVSSLEVDVARVRRLILVGDAKGLLTGDNSKRFLGEASEIQAEVRQVSRRLLVIDRIESGIPERVDPKSGVKLNGGLFLLPAFAVTLEAENSAKAVGMIQKKVMNQSPVLIILGGMLGAVVGMFTGMAWKFFGRLRAIPA